MKWFPRILVPAIFLASVLLSCGRKENQSRPVVPAYNKAIQAFTSGVVSVESPIRVRLSSPIADSVDYTRPLPEKLFSFDPGIRGSAFWADPQTLEFRPDEKMRSGTRYQVKVDLKRIIEPPEDQRYFSFDFETIRQAILVDLQGIQAINPADLAWNRLTGKLVTADVAPEEEVHKIIKAEQDGHPLSLRWEPGDEPHSYLFSIDSLKRSDKPETVTVEWDGSRIGAEQKESRSIEIPALGDFRVMDVSVKQQPEQYVLVRFSDPLQKDQNLSGLVQFPGQYLDIRYIIENNELRVYPAVRQAGKLDLELEPGIRNIMGYRLEKAARYSVQFESLKPAVRLLGKGVILPGSTGLILPFEAVNLNAVDVSVVKIYENNIPQFLQVNALDGSYQLKRAGRLILKKTIPLRADRPVDMGTWNTFSLDLAELINPDPGSIYRVRIGFRKSQSLYPCEGASSGTDLALREEEENWDEDWENEMSYWDAAEDYYYDDYDDYSYYDWDERDNPCSPAYYGNRRSVSRNILASDLGIIAKGGNDQGMLFAVTNLLTTEPVPDVALDIYNFQQQKIGSVRTNHEGLAEIRTETKPFLLIARQGEQRGYLRLDDASSLSLSTFDVSGNVVQKGLKGYIYGERGVWRPGDSLFLTFVLEDESGQLPAGHPVVFELRNPQGLLVKKMINTSGVNGFYRFATATSPDDQTGYWSASVDVGGTRFRKNLRIETIKPNRLKIKLDFGKELLSVTDPEIRGTLEVSWLHGAAARNLRADVKLSLLPVNTRFDRYRDYEFDDPARNFWSDEITLFDGRTDETGKALLSAGIHTEEKAPGMLQANFVTRAFEEGGGFSTDQFSIPYSPYSSYVGIKTPSGDRARGMLLTDTTHLVEVATVDPSGNPVSRKNLDVRIYKIEWRWWWEGADHDLASYISSHYNQSIFEKKIDTRDGRGSFSFRIDYPEWGRYLVRVMDPVSGHATGKILYIDWPGWAGRAQREMPGAASILSFSADKDKVNVGEEVTVTLPSSGQGRALVSLENGTGVLDAFWVPVTGKETRFSFRTTPAMSPNVYVHVSLLQPHAQTANDLPIRLYGVIPLSVEDPETRLDPVIDMPDVLRPEEAFQVKVREKNGKSMTYTLAIVDEGLLDLTRFPTPDPWAVFYAREALGVRTWDVFDQVMGAYGGKIEKVFAIGGDADRGETGSRARANRFVPVVKFLGPFSLEAKKTATHNIRLPRYVGSVRTMVVAGNQGAYGKAEKTTPVRKPLMVLATLPRVLGPGEEVKLPVTVFAMEESIKSVRVEIMPNEMLQPADASSREIRFTETGDQVIYFNLRVTEKPGIGKVRVIASSGRERAEDEIEIDIRIPNTPAVETAEAVVEAGRDWNHAYQPLGMSGTNAAVLEVSNIPPVDFGRRLRYLLAYPHGCVEQITSAAFPQLYLGEVMDLNENARKKAENNIREALVKLKSFQLPDGSMSYWPGRNEPNDWGTSYAGHFLLEAEARGYSLPIGMKESWIAYQKKAARQWSPPKNYQGYFNYALYDLAQAYRLYTLALAGEPVLSAMNRLREKNDLSVQAAWRLAAAYVLAGQTAVARQLVQDKSTEIKAYDGSSYCYGSDIRDKAMILETMSLLGDRTEAIPLMKDISNSLTGNRWMSTQTVAYCLLAMSKYAGTAQATGELKFSYSLNGQAVIRASSSKPVIQIDLEGEKPGSVDLSNTGSSILFVRLISTGTPLAGEEKEITRTVELRVRYLDINGEPMDISRLSQGTDFMAEVTVRNLQSYRYLKDMALTQIFPSGWEIRNTRFEGTQLSREVDNPDYMDIRDDRVYSYFDLGFGKKKTFLVMLNAAYLGKFYQPGASVEAMYDPGVQAKLTGAWVEVVPPGQ